MDRGGFLIFLVLIGMVVAIGRGFWQLYDLEEAKKKEAAKAAKVGGVKPS